jgi:ADP-heptose:LPS heptosyltransferase
VELVEGVHKLAVLRANAIGDYLVSLPALEALRAAYPQAELVLLGAGWHAGFLAGRPGPVDRCLAVPPTVGVRDDQPPAPAEHPT